MDKKTKVYVVILILLTWTLLIPPTIYALIYLLTNSGLSHTTLRALAFLIQCAVYLNLAMMAAWSAKQLDTTKKIFNLSAIWPGLITGLILGLGIIFYRYLLEGQSLFANIKNNVSGPAHIFDALFIPFIESVIWCGTVYTALRRHHKPLVSILISTAIFMIAHFGNLSHISGKPMEYRLGYVVGYSEHIFILGLLCTAIYALTGSLAAPVIVHFLINLSKGFLKYF